MPAVSVILPVYNRFRTLRRAVESVVHQTFGDWELIIVDDGSTDGSTSTIDGMDPRIRIVPQANGGVASARNAGIASATGEIIAFLDSDDEWLPGYLELGAAFLREYPAAAFVTMEFLSTLPDGSSHRHMYEEIAHWYPRFARTVGSVTLERPAADLDGYLRFYESREPVGPWGEHLCSAPGGDRPFHYSGRLDSLWRWGYLTSLICTLIRRPACVEAGPFDPSYRSAEDYGFLARLFSRHEAHLVSVPVAVVHHDGPDDHLATGSRTLQFRRDYLRMFEELFSPSSGDRELATIRGYRQFDVASAALQQGDVVTARQFLSLARTSVPHFHRAGILALFSALMPRARITGRVYEGALMLENVMRGRPIPERQPA